MRGCNRQMFLAIAVVLTPWLGLPAQETSNKSSITIVVKDVAGGIIAGAEVEVAPQTSAIAKTLSTDNDGNLFMNMAPGSYKLLVKSRGFRNVKEQIQVREGTPQTFEIFLEPGSCSGDCVNLFTLLSPAGNPFGPTYLPVPGNIAKGGSPVAFPEHSEAVSPDGRYAVVGIFKNNRPHHPVYLEDKKLRTRRKLFTYDQNVVFLWNEDSSAVAVTLFDGSRSSVCSIFSVDKQRPPIQSQDALSHQLPIADWNDLERILSNHAASIEALRWLGPTELEVSVRIKSDKNTSHLLYYHLRTDFPRAWLPSRCR